MNRPRFDQIPLLWERDGSLRDVYLVGFGADGWLKFIRFASAYRLTYKVDGQDTKFIGVDNVFSDREAGHCLSIWVGDAVVNCHFFLDNEIELDLDPCEVSGSKEHEALLEFVEGAALAVGVNASVTPEGAEDSPLITFDVQTETWRIHV